MFGGDNREVAEAVTALTDWPRCRCTADMAALFSTAPHSLLLRVGSPKRQEKISIQQADCIVGMNELKRGKRPELTKLCGDISCPYCSYLAHLRVIGYTTERPSVSGRCRGRCGKQARHSSQTHLIHGACALLCAAASR